MTKPKGRHVPAPSGSAPKRRKNARDRTAAASLGVRMQAKERRIGEREAACDARDAEFVRRQEQQSKQEAEFVKRQEQQSKREEAEKFAEKQSKEKADFVKRQEHQRLELAASLNDLELAVQGHGQSEQEIESAKRQEQQQSKSREEAEFAKQQSEERAEFVKRQEQQRLELAASLNRKVVAVQDQQQPEQEAESVKRQQQQQQSKSREEVQRRQAASDTKRKSEEEVVTPQRQARQEAAAETRDALCRRTGALLDSSQSRDILLLYFGLVESGMKENPAAKRTAELLRVGKSKVFKIRAHWDERHEFLTSSGEGRGAASAEDGRRARSPKQRAKLHAPSSVSSARAEEVFRRTVGE